MAMTANVKKPSSVDVNCFSRSDYGTFNGSQLTVLMCFQKKKLIEHIHHCNDMNMYAALFVDRFHKMVRILSSGEIVPDDDPRLNRQTDTRERRPQVRRPYNEYYQYHND